VNETAPEPTAPVAEASPNQADYSFTANTVIDNTTRLEWQRADDDVQRNWYEALDYCSGLTLDSKRDWRLPSIVELQSIVDYGEATSPIINSTAFPDTDSVYWSATTLESNSASAWYLNFGNGGIFSIVTVKTDDNFVRCVRSTLNTFIDNGNGSVADTATGLTWQKQDDNVTRSHSDAISYCNGLILAGNSNWRLPSIKELITIVDYRSNDPAINGDVFPNTNSAFYWSVSSRANSLDSAWDIDFNFGSSFSANKSDQLFVRCVRD
jgi:hypothetical protein